MQFENIFCVLQKMVGKMASSEEGVSIPPYEAKECIEDIPKKMASNLVKYKSTSDFWVTG